jgi:tRNA dimethylallyltransferase
MPILVGGTGLYLESILKVYRLLEAPANQSLRGELALFSIDALREKLLSVASSTHNTTDILDRERLIRAIEIAEHGRTHEPEPFPEIRPLIFGIHRERTTLRKRITERLKERMAGGMIEEVERLHASGIPWERLDYFGLEYRLIAAYLRKEMNRNDMFQKLNSAIHEFAKRQDTWFRRMERNGALIHWLEGDNDPFSQAITIIKALPGQTGLSVSLQ